MLKNNRRENVKCYHPLADEFCEKTGWKKDYKYTLEYWMAIRRVINPLGYKEVGEQPCSGADALGFFLVTDAKLGIFVDSLPFGSEEESKQARFKLDITEDDYWSLKSSLGGWVTGFTPSFVVAATKFLRISLRWELEAMGAEAIMIREIERNLHQIDFEWKYWGEERSKHRRILFFSYTDAQDTKNYPQRLRDLLREGIDFYFEKASFGTEGYYTGCFDGGSRWEQFTSITNLKPDSILIVDHHPGNKIEAFEEIKSDYLLPLEEKGATFGVGSRAFLWRRV